MPMTPLFSVNDGTLSKKAAGYPWCVLDKFERAVTTCDCGRRSSCDWFIHGGISLSIDKSIAKWPDVLGSDSRPEGSLIVSSRVREVIESLSPACIEETGDVILCAKGKRIQLESSKKYSWIRMREGARIDLEQSGIGTPYCAKEYKWDSDDALAPGYRWMIEPSTWTGAWLFRLAGFCRGPILCTAPFIELARKEMWTNFRFLPAGLPNDIRGEMRYLGYPPINYLGKTWPPREFDPDYDVLRWNPETDAS